MKKLATILVSLGILFGAWAITFGLPEQITRLWSAPASTTADTTDGTERARGGPGGERGGRTTTVVLEPLEERSYPLTLRTVGSATSLRKTSVRVGGTGDVVETSLQANALVEQGDVLLRLDDRAERLSLEIAQAELERARDTVTRYQSLQSAGNLTLADVTLSEAQVDLRLAEANVGMAEVALEDRTLRAPISGRLGLSDVQEGDRVSEGDIIVTIDDSSTLIAEFEVPERSIGLLEAGKKVLVGTPTFAGRVFEGKITGFDSRLDSITRSATVRAEIDNSDGLLLAGMTFTIRMIEETEPLPVLPATAITWERDGAGIWISDNGRATRIPVTIRYRDGDEVWIDADVAPGTQVVTEGAAKLREGSAITDAAATGVANSGETSNT